MINQGREAAYAHYRKILDHILSDGIGEDLEIALADSCDKKRYIFWKGRIMDAEFIGTNYFLGKIMQKTFITPSDSRIEYQLVAALPKVGDFEGILPFEEFSNRFERHLIVGRKKFIVMADSLKEITTNPELMCRVRYAIDTYSRLMSLKRKR